MDWYLLVIMLQLNFPKMNDWQYQRQYLPCHTNRYKFNNCLALMASNTITTTCTTLDRSLDHFITYFPTSPNSTAEVKDLTDHCQPVCYIYWYNPCHSMQWHGYYLLLLTILESYVLPTTQADSPLHHSSSLHSLLLHLMIRVIITTGFECLSLLVTCIPNIFY